MEATIRIMSTNELLPMLRLFQLLSPNLPVGAYSYSQGLEWAVEDGLVCDAHTAQQWINEILQNSVAKLDGPILARSYQAWAANDMAQLKYWNDMILSCRETMELQNEDKHLGIALGKVLDSLGLNWSNHWNQIETAFVTPYALAAVTWKMSLPLVLSAYFWNWLENQVLAAIKLVPLGQSAGQQMLFELATIIPCSVENSLQLDDQQIGSSQPILAIASSKHETQYSRLFRS